MQTTEDKLTEIYRFSFGHSDCPFTNETRLEDMGMDSLDNVEFIMEVEEEFGIEISDERAEKCVTVKDMIDLVDELVAAK